MKKFQVRKDLFGLRSGRKVGNCSVGMNDLFGVNSSYTIEEECRPDIIFAKFRRGEEMQRVLHHFIKGIARK